MEGNTIHSTATIFDIQRFSIHDGPGIRTLIFFKGCTLRCAWCQNPESIRSDCEMAFYPDRCIGCGRCAGVCPTGAIIDGKDKRIDYEKCNSCGKCGDICPGKAVRLIGKSWKKEDLLETCLLDREFFDVSGGGITLSGGEPVLHSSFLTEFLPMLKAENIHLLLETAGNYVFSLLEPLIPFLDTIYYDYKLPDQGTYLRYTGSHNRLILKNLHRLVDAPVRLRVRVPLIPGINTKPGQIQEMCATLKSMGINEVSLLEYNPFWEVKIERLNTQQKRLGLSSADIDYEKITDSFNIFGDIKTG